MTTQPILTAESIIIAAFTAALTPYVGTYNTRPKAYYQEIEIGATPPYAVFQPQADIARLTFVGVIDAEVLITLKAFATKKSLALSLLEAITPAMDELSYPGFTITASYRSSPAIPPLDGIYQAAHTYRIRIERN